MADKNKKNRLGYIEDSDGPLPKEMTDKSQLDPIPLDFIDFSGEPIDPTLILARGMEENDIVLETRGEVAARVITRVLWMLVRIAIGGLFFWFVLRGTQCGFLEFT